MATSFAPSVPTKRLLSPILSTDSSFTLNNVLSWKGLQDGTTTLVAADFPSTGRGVFRNPSNSQIEFFTFDPSTIATGTLTILARGLDYRGGTSDGAVTAAKYNWPANSTLVELGSNPPAEAEDYVDKTTDEIIGGIKNFSSSPTVPTPMNPTEVASKAYVDDVAISGAGFADDSTAGLVERATQAEIEAGTTLGGTGASLFINPSRSGARLHYGYAADAQASDTYVVTCAPVPTAYSTGMLIQFKANTTNTGACTINVNTLGAKSLKINKDLDPRDNYIKAGQHILIEYDGTNFQILSVSGQPQVSQDGSEIFGVSSSGNDTYAITLAPVPAAYVTGQRFYFKPDTANTAAATLNVNGLGAKAVVRPDGSALVTGDILANQIIGVEYDGTSVMMITPLGTGPLFANGTTTKNAADASAAQSIAHGLGRAPRNVRIKALILNDSSAARSLWADTVYNGTTQSSVSIYEGSGPAYALATTFSLNAANATGDQTGVVTVDATNIIITWTKTNSPTGTYTLLWEAQA